MIASKDFYRGRDITHAAELLPEIKANGTKLIDTVNALLYKYNFGHLTATSGWRPLSIQKEVNPRNLGSSHVMGNAIDIGDPGQKLSTFLTENPKVLKEFGLYMENPKSTPTWCHLQQNPPKSGRSIFNP